MASRVVVIIVNYNGGDAIIECLRALCAQTIQPDSIHVVDNASQDGSAEKIAALFPQLTLHCMSQNLGFAAANNVVINTLNIKQTDWVVTLNPDAVAQHDWLENLLQSAKLADKRVAMFASQMRTLLVHEDNSHEQTDILDGAGDAYHVSGLCWRRGYGRHSSKLAALETPVFAPCAAAGLYRLSALLEIGGFDETYFCYNEDVDLGFRLRLLGYECSLVENALVYHIGSNITGKNSDFSVYYGHRNLVWTYFKNMPASLLLRYLPQHILMNLAIIFYYARQGRLKVILKSKWHAVKALPRIFRQRREIQHTKSIQSWQLRKMMVHQMRLAFQRGKR